MHKKAGIKPAFSVWGYSGVIQSIFGNLNSLIIQIIIYYVQTYMKNTIN